MDGVEELADYDDSFSHDMGDMSISSRKRIFLQNDE
jgi:hypothetical protein